MSNQFNGIPAGAASAYAQDFLSDNTYIQKGNNISLLKNQVDGVLGAIQGTQDSLVDLNAQLITLQQQLDAAVLDLISTIAAKLEEPITY